MPLIEEAAVTANARGVLVGVGVAQPFGGLIAKALLALIRFSLVATAYGSRPRAARTTTANASRSN